MPVLGVLGLGGGISNTSIASNSKLEAFDVQFTGTVYEFDSPAPGDREYRNLVWESPGTFTFTVRGDGSTPFIGDVFVLGGGGAGGDIDVYMGPGLGNAGGESAHNVFVGGGGGAGSYDQDINIPMSAGTYTIEVGEGGDGYNNDQFGFPANGPGGNSTFTSSDGTISFIGYGGNHGYQIYHENPNSNAKGPPTFSSHGQCGGECYAIDQFGNRTAVGSRGLGERGNTRWGMDDCGGYYEPYYISDERPPVHYGQPESTDPPFIQKFEQVGTVGHSGGAAGYRIGSLRYTGDAPWIADRACEFGNAYSRFNFNNDDLYYNDDSGMDGANGFPAPEVVFGGWENPGAWPLEWGAGGGGGYNSRPAAGDIQPFRWQGGRGGYGGGGNGGAIWSFPYNRPERDRVTGQNATSYGSGGGGGGVARFAYAVYQSPTNTGDSQGGKGGNGSSGIVILRYIKEYL